MGEYPPFGSSSRKTAGPGLFIRRQQALYPVGWPDWRNLHYLSLTRDRSTHGSTVLCLSIQIRRSKGPHWEWFHHHVSIPPIPAHWSHAIRVLSRVPLRTNLD